MSRAAETCVLLAVPAALVACAVLDVGGAAVLTLAVALAAIAVFFAAYERSRPALRQVMPTVVLAALAAAGRVLFAAVPDVKPVSAICILAGVVLGRRSGFMTGALAALTSNFFFGQGAWTPWQMYAWGLVGYLAGVLAERGLMERTGVVLAYGFVSPLTWASVVAAYAAGLPFDLVHGVATVAFLAALYVPWRRKLERVVAKYALAQRA